MEVLKKKSTFLFISITERKALLSLTQIQKPNKYDKFNYIKILNSAT